MTHRRTPITTAVAARRAVYALAIARGADADVVRQVRLELDAELAAAGLTGAAARLERLPARAAAVKAVGPLPRRRRA